MTWNGTQTVKAGEPWTPPVTAWQLANLHKFPTSTANSTTHDVQIFKVDVPGLYKSKADGTETTANVAGHVSGTPTTPGAGTITLYAQDRKSFQTTTKDVPVTVEPGAKIQVLPLPPVFTERGNTITIPSVTGAAYRVDGQPVAPGDHHHADGPAEVTAESTGDEYEIPGKAVRVWKHTFVVDPLPPALAYKLGDRVQITADEWAALAKATHTGPDTSYWEFDRDNPTVPGVAVVDRKMLDGTVAAPSTYRLAVSRVTRLGTIYGNGSAVLTVTSSTPEPTDPEPTDPEPTDPEPTDPEPTDPEPTDPPQTPDDWLESAAVDAVRLIGRPAFLDGDTPTPDLETARAQAPLVAAFVEGYTRGRGFSTLGEPLRPVGMVIRSALSRLVQNPEQVDYYSAGDYSEKGAKMTGFTLPELYILNRYRRLWA